MTKVLMKKKNNKIDDKISDERDKISTIHKKKIIEDKDIVQLKNLSTDIEKINWKEIDDLGLDKSDTEERDKIEIPDEVIIIDREKGLWWWSR